MPELDRQKVLAGRKAIEAYRTAHAALYSKPWHKGVPEEHTPLLKALINVLKGFGFTSSETDFEPRKTEILAKFFDASNKLDITEDIEEGKRWR